MEALSAPEIPVGKQWQYEPKWDGFRCIAFRDNDKVELQSKAGQPLTRYFPDVEALLRALPVKRFVLDGEITVSIKNQLSFDDLLMRIHPARSRVLKLSQETPATYIVFDLLVDEQKKPLIDLPLAERRKRLEIFAKKYFRGEHMHLSPRTFDFNEVRRWYKTMGGGLDGVVAKRLDATYESGERTGAMQKIKNLRTADCVVGGFRYAEKGKVVGSLLLGLFNDQGKLDHVGFASNFGENNKKQLTERLESLIGPPGFTGKAPGGPSRWSTRRSTEWQPLKSKLVVEVQYDHFSGGRFRHGTKFLRWRADKSPAQCKMRQVIHESRSPLTLL
jgi:ATP-dependent DNA ligase